MLPTVVSSLAIKPDAGCAAHCAMHPIRYRAGHTPMAESEHERWNARYRAEDYDFTPAAWVRAIQPVLQAHAVGARALDLASGGGRNALYLAELGYAVDA